MEMEPLKGNIKVMRTARYFMLGDSTLPVETLVIVLHGYGMQAKEFLMEFKNLVKPGVLVVAPEGLSRFYRKGFSGEVVASWMTKEDRLLEIGDYINYLDELHQMLVPSGTARTVVLGFSQGTATASRWVAKGNTVVSELVLWCGEFAGEIESIPANLAVIRHIHALRDEFITPEQSEQQVKRLKLFPAAVFEYAFDDGHTLHPPTLAAVFRDAGI